MKQALLLAIAASVFGDSHSAFAETYPWPNGEHHCLVESSSYVTTDASDRGVWADAPKDFSIRLSSCPAYREGEKRLSDKHPNVTRILFECDEHGDTQSRFQVVEPYAPFYGVVSPIVPSRLTRDSLSTNNGVLFRLHSDGRVDIGKLQRPSGTDTGAWRLVSAQCSPRRRRGAN